MSADRLTPDFCCSDCNEYFQSASHLLTHFAMHASQNVNQRKYEDNNKNVNMSKSGKKNVPDLYPINSISKKRNENIDVGPKPSEKEGYMLHNNRSKITCSDTDECQYAESSNNVQTENDVEDFYPLKYCSISMDDIKESNANTPVPKQKRYNKMTGLTAKKKYPCSYCAKVFGWSTDLKRHVLTHTGERPFKCKSCDASFTRNFLLQKHESKTHSNETDWIPVQNKLRMPNLKPICTKPKAKDSLKPNKQKIKIKCFYTPENGRKNEFHGMLRSRLSETETIVQ